MIDTHAHLTNPAFSGDLAEVLLRANYAGVTNVVAVSETLDDAHAVLALSQAHSEVHAALGLHPEHVTTLLPPQLSENLTMISELLSSTNNIIAIGEVGLDHTPRVLSSSPAGADAAKEAQRSTFAHFLTLSRDLHLPVTVHSRGAGRVALDVVMSAATDGPVAVVMHAFDGRAIYAERALSAIQDGLYFSVPPSVVRSPQKEKLVRRLPLERLMLESDAPVLGPVAGERNEPANIVKTVEAIARMKGLGISLVQETLTNNTTKMFPRLA